MKKVLSLFTLISLFVLSTCSVEETESNSSDAVLTLEPNEPGKFESQDADIEVDADTFAFPVSISLVNSSAESVSSVPTEDNKIHKVINIEATRTDTSTDILESDVSKPVTVSIKIDNIIFQDGSIEIWSVVDSAESGETTVKLDEITIVETGTGYIISFKTKLVNAQFALVAKASAEDDGGGNGDPSSDSEDTTAPTPGKEIAFDNKSYSSVDVSWGEASDNTSAAASLKYKVVRASASEDIDTIDEADAISGGDLISDWATFATVIDSSLSFDNNYCYGVLVRDEAMNMSLYTPDCISTADNVDPVIGSAITFPDVKHNSIDVSFGRATDDVTAQGDLEYKTVRAATTDPIDSIDEVVAITGGDIVYDFGADINYLNDTGRSPSTQYCYAAVVRDEAGNMALYPPQCQTTNAAPKRMFITASFFNGMLGGPSGADGSCASDANKPATGTYKALLRASTRFPPSTDWVLAASTTYSSVHTSNVVGTTNASSTFDFPLDSAPGDPMDGYDYWSGFNSSWGAAMDNCSDWTSTATNGGIGETYSTNSAFISGTPHACTGMDEPLLCVEQ